MTPKKKKTESQVARLRKRDNRIRHLYLVRGLTPPEIRDVMVAEGEIDTRSPESGLRTVQMIVKGVRERAKPEEILRLRRPIETEKARQRLLHVLNAQLNIAEDDSVIQRQVVTPKGDVQTVEEQRYPAGVKQRALKDAVVVIEKLAQLDGADLTATEEQGAKTNDDGKPIVEPAFSFNFPNAKGGSRELDDLIAMNLGAGKAN